MSEKKYIVPFENNDTIDIHNLYDIIGQETGLNQHEIFEAIYTEDGNGSRTYVDDINCEEILQDGWADDAMRKVYQWFYDHIQSGELPYQFFVHVWW
jgi:hypothetical protein